MGMLENFFHESERKYSEHYLVYAEGIANEVDKILYDLPNLINAFGYFSQYDREIEKTIRLVRAIKPALDQAGHWEDLRSLLEVVQDICEKLGLVREQLEFIAVLAQMYTNRSEYTSSIKWSTKTIQLADKTNNKSALAEGYLRLGWTYLYLAQYQNAKECLQNSQTLASEIGNQSILESSLHFLGRVHAEMGDFEKAVGFFRTEIKLFSEINSLNPPPFVLLRGGNYLLELGEVMESRRLIEHSMQLFRESGNQGGIAYSLRGLAKLELIEGKTDNAVKYLKEALQIINYQRGEFNIQQDLAETYILTGNIDEADRLLNLAIEYRRSFGERKGLAEALYLKGKVLETRGEFEKAIEVYQQSLNIFNGLGCFSSITDPPRLAILRLKSIMLTKNQTN